MQVICDSTLKIQDIVARWPGSSHDQTIFNNSNVRMKFESEMFGNKLLLGDGGYGITKYLITPLLQPSNAVERLFNESQIRSRNPIERCFGVWKRRFPIISLGMRVHLTNSQTIIIATAVLHNIAILEHEEVPPIDPRTVQRHNDIANIHNNDNNYNDNNITRNDKTRRSLINNYFRSML